MLDDHVSEALTFDDLLLVPAESRHTPEGCGYDDTADQQYQP